MRWAGQAGYQVSIFEETGGGLGAVAHDRSLELFFDRYEVIARFVSLINEDPAPRRVLYLHGLGGNGKSLLLRYLAARCCVRLPPGEWERVRRLPDAELPAALAGVAKAARVPVARIDFGARPVGENRPQECFSALFMLKQQLAQHRISTPRFDFAAVTYLHKLGFDLDRRLPELFPRGELAVALDLADALLPVQVMQVGQSLFGAVDRRLDDMFTRRRVQRRLHHSRAGAAAHVTRCAFPPRGASGFCARRLAYLASARCQHQDQLLHRRPAPQQRAGPAETTPVMGPGLTGEVPWRRWAGAAG